MRLIILSCAVFVFSAGFALATDEFGSRFSEQTPSALGDPEQVLQDALQDIEPAAGEGESAVEQDAQASEEAGENEKDEAGQE